MKRLHAGGENIPPENKEPLPAVEKQREFILLSGNDSFSAWFYTDIMANRGRGIAGL